MMFLSTSRSKRFAAVLIFCCLTTVVWSGEPQFRVDSYIPIKFTDFEWMIDGYLSAQGYHRDITFQPRYDTLSHSRVETSDEQEIRTATNISYRYETIPWYFQGSIRAAYILHNQSPSSPDHRRDGYKPGIFPTLEAGKYLLSDFFVAASGSGGWVYSHNLHDVNPDTRIITYTVDGVVSAGWGRVYEGYYAATTLYALDELRQNGLILKDADFDDMLVLTKMVHHYRVSHSIDSRLHKIEALSAIMAFLEKQGITRSAGQYGYLLIQDVWDYFPKYNRPFGWRVKAGIGMKYEHYIRQMTDEYESAYGNYFHAYEHEERQINNPFFETVAEYHNPIGLRWQFDIVGSWRYFFNYFDKTESQESAYSPTERFAFSKEVTRRQAIYDISLAADVRYIIDSRSTLELEPSFILQHYNSTFSRLSFVNDYPEKYSKKTYDHKYKYLRFLVNFEYRLSIPTTLLVSLNLSHRYLEDNDLYQVSFSNGFIVKERESSYYLSVQIKHYLF